jgi:hypothetical protein
MHGSRKPLNMSTIPSVSAEGSRSAVRARAILVDLPGFEQQPPLPDFRCSWALKVPAGRTILSVAGWELRPCPSRQYPRSRSWSTVCFHVLRYSLQLRAAGRGSNLQQRGPLLTWIYEAHETSLGRPLLAVGNPPFPRRRRGAPRGAVQLRRCACRNRACSRLPDSRVRYNPDGVTALSAR